MPANTGAGRRQGQRARATTSKAQTPLPARAPAGLAASGRDAWKRLRALPWVSASDHELALRACRLADELEVLAGILRDDPRDWRTRNALRLAERAFVQALSLLGASPTDRARLRESPPEDAPDVVAERSRLEAMQLVREGSR